MATLYATDFENGGSAPSGWFMSAGWSASTAQAKSGSYQWAQGSSNSTNLAAPNSTDSALGSATPGNQRVSCWFYLTSSAASSGYIGLYLRMSTNGFSATCYRFDLVSGSAVTNIQKGSGGSYTSLASRTTSYSAGWYQMIATASGSSLSTQIQNAAGQWMQSDGSWSSTPATCLSISDSTIAAGSASYAGAIYYATATSGTGIDLFSLEDLSSTTLNGAAALIGAGSLSAPGVAQISGAAGLVGVSSLAAAGAALIQGGAALTGTALLTPAGVVITQATANLIGAGSLQASGAIAGAAAAALVGVGALTATGKIVQLGQAALSGIGALSGSGVDIVPGGAALIGCSLVRGTGSNGAVLPLIIIGSGASGDGYILSGGLG